MQSDIINAKENTERKNRTSTKEKTLQPVDERRKIDVCTQK